SIGGGHPALPRRERATAPYRSGDHSCLCRKAAAVASDHRSRARIPRADRFCAAEGRIRSLLCRLRRRRGENSDPPQRRELHMNWTRLAVGIASLGLAFSSFGCGESAGAKPAALPTNQFIVGIDLSASRSVEALRDSRRLLDNLVETRLNNGD